MRSTAPSLLVLVATLSVAMAGRLCAQHAGHEGMAAATSDTARTWSLHLMAQTIPLITHAAPSAGGESRTELSLTQTLIMTRASWWRGHATLDGTLNLEGATMPGGELSTGAFGEGFVDRRHPHASLHELVVSGLAPLGPLWLSASVGRGFAPFGTDDPMVRPFVKYPINHHLAQILERAVLIGAARVGPAILEASTFSGEEPVGPGSLPRAERFGDSWAVRGTLLPTARTELQGSYARVASPEAVSGFGLDQRKRSISARATSADGARYLLIEWARTVDRDRTRDVDAFSYESALVEGATAAGPLRLALRLEQTDRPEEEHLADPFRVQRPSSDLSIGGLTRWRTVTAHTGLAPLTRGVLAGYPFVEVAALRPVSRDPRALITPERRYGTSRLWMVTAGFRIRVGGAHTRMGRYGVALPEAPPAGDTSGGASPHVH